MLKKSYNNIFPKSLSLFLSGAKINYKAAESQVDEEFIGLLRNNKNSILFLMQNNNYNRIDLYPLAQNQKSQWFINQTAPDSSAYNVGIAIKVYNGLDISILKTTIEKLIEKHWPLRSRVLKLKNEKDFQLCQIASDSYTPFINENRENYTNEKDLIDKINQDNKIPFNIETGPLFRTFVYSYEGLDFILFSFHHIICDAISLQSFTKDFSSAYEALLNRTGFTLEKNEKSYAKFILDQYRFLQSVEATKQIDFWRDSLKNVSQTLELPVDFTRPKVHQFNGNTIHFQFSGKDYKEIKASCNKHKVTLSTYLFTIFQILLAKFSKQNSFCIGFPVSGRTDSNYSDIFGYLNNTLPIPCEFNPDSTFTDILKNNTQNILNALENQNIPFSVIVDELANQRDLSRTPIFQVFFNFLNKKALGSLTNFLSFDHEKRNFGSLEISPLKLHDQEGRFDIDLEIFDNDESLYCSLKYNTDIFSENTANRIVENFRHLLFEINSNESYKTNISDNKQDTISVNITGTFTTEPLEKGLNYWLNKINFPAKINFVGFNQIFQQLLNPTSEFNTSKNAFNVILLRIEDIFYNTNTDKTELFQELKESLITCSKKNPNNNLILTICPPSDKYISNTEFNEISNRLENELFNLSLDLNNLIIVHTSDFIDEYKLHDYYEPVGEEQGNIPYKNNFFACAATLITRKIHSTLTPPIKAIVLDCDNTLWKGIIGEDGINGIEFGEQELEFQKFLIEQNKKGVLLCLCSKNNENDIWEVFEKNDKILLKKEHISFFRINWNPKSKNIISLANEINISLDSIVFIDDNPVECEEVKANIPAVITIQKRTDAKDLDYIVNSWIFDRNKVTKEDTKRALMYKEEAERVNLKSKLKSYKDFINELQIQINIKSAGSDEITRISQLTFRTNQFNFTSVRRTESEIKSLVNNPEYHVAIVHLEDKYGDYGIIGAFICNEKTDSINIDTFLISCRALGKGVEHAMILRIAELAKGKNKKSIEIPFSKSEKNIVGENFLNTHFSDNKFKSSNNITFIVPVEVASNLKFDPDSIQKKDENSDSNQKIDYSPDIIQRNNLFSDIIESYSNIDTIVEKIYGNEPVKKQINQHKNEVKRNQIEAGILDIWRDVLDNPEVKPTDNFFDAGGDSILIPNIIIRIKNELNISLNVVDIFQYPTVKLLTDFISPVVDETQNYSIDSQTQNSDKECNKSANESSNTDIAIIGLTGRFPGANNIDEFWQLIKNGKEAITHYTREELEKKGVAEELLNNPNYVYAIGSIPTADKFDASFFGFTPREADFMDPQHRVFLESCHEALEIAGYSSDNYSGSIGVFGGSGPDNYILKNLFQHSDTLRNIGEFQTIINNGKDFLTTHVSYKLNLNGPSIDIQTACSTSLVAVHYACNSLRNNESDITLAGGVFIHTPREIGYMYEPGGIFSPKGQCRPFDKDADGTLFGEGVGVLVLKKYADAVRDNDTIWGIIKGSAINNDGAVKVGYTAPGIVGQSKVISQAQKFAGVKPSDISLIEAHGTGTNLGDPIEVKALTNVFREETPDREYCVIGSVKANIGHLDASAGVAGLIKTTLALKHKQLPPSINFNEPNQELRLTDTPFYINTKLKEWETTDNKPRIAGVSSFGIGGTNAHCIIQEAPEISSEQTHKKYHILPVSAKTEAALQNIKRNLGSYLKDNECNIADMAFTLLQGRKRFNYRSTIICSSQGEAIEKIVDAQVITKKFTDPKIVFLFTGQGSQYNGMTRGLHEAFPLFREVLDKAFEIAKNDYSLNLEEIIFSDEYKSEINNTGYAQPALFVVQYATAKLLQSFGVSPGALIGHSIGEITAAAFSGLLTFEDALKLVIIRGRLMQAQKPGAMLSIQLPAEKVKDILPDTIDFALQNAPNFSVVSGDFDAIADFKNMLETDYTDIMVSQLNTSHAFHSRMMDPALDEFKKEIADISFNTIEIPFVSNTTGTWVNKQVVGNADYWVNHIRSTVNFVDGINTLLEEKNTIFIEVGPGISLTTLLSQFEKENQKIISIPTIRHPRKRVNDVEFFLNAIAGLWSYGADHLFENWYEGEKRKRIPLPTYPFERKTHWIDPVVPFSYHVKTKSSYANLQQSNNSSISAELQQSPEISTKLHERPDIKSTYTHPTTETEKKLVQNWKDLLGFESIGVDDNFFELGGHSLLASSLLIRIKNEFGISVKLQNLDSDSITIKELSKILTDDPEIQTKAKPKYNILVKKTNEITDEEWTIYVENFNSIFNRNYSKEDFIRKYTETPLGFSFHSLVYFDKIFVGAQSHIVELFDYKKEIIRIACGVDLFIKEEYRKSFTLLSDLWESANPILLEHNVKALFSNPLPDLIEYNEAAQTGFKIIARLNSYVLPLTFKVIHRRLGFLDLLYKPILQIILSAKSRNRSPIHNNEKLFKAHEYYSPYNYKTIQEEIGELKFTWIWSKITHLKIIIINDNFKTKGDVYKASKYLAQKYGTEAKAITFITANKLLLPFTILNKRELFIGKLLTDNINSDEFFDINNWEFKRGFFD